MYGHHNYIALPPILIMLLKHLIYRYEHCKGSLAQGLKTLGQRLGTADNWLQDVSKVSIPVAGGFSGAIGWFISFPLDCIKSNIQGT